MSTMQGMNPWVDDRTRLTQGNRTIDYGPQVQEFDPSVLTEGVADGGGIDPSGAAGAGTGSLTSVPSQSVGGSGMSADISFSDPIMAQQLRQLDYDTQTGIADLRLQGQRLIEDQNLFRPYLKRRFSQQADRMAGSVADRGFSGAQRGVGNGVMMGQMKNLSEEQTYAAGQYERRNARQLSDIEAAIANLTASGLMQSGESVRGGAGRLADYLVGIV